VNRAPEPVRPSPKKEIDPPVKFNFDPEIEPPLSSRSDDSFFEEYDRLHADERRRPQEAPEAPAGRSSKDIAAIRKASQDAYDRYRSNYTKKQKKMTGKVPYLKFHRFLTVVYVLALGAFVGSVTLMNVLPLKMELAFIAVLALLSLIILFQTRRPTVKKWGRRFATLLAILLIGVYGVGTVYALGTMSFLDSTSVENDKAVPIITRDPFNVVITGIDVRGTIDEQGRSDVNMIVTVNPQTNQVLMTSIPRDYQIYMPDKDNAMDKLTHTGFYSVQTTTLAEEDLLDITANYYVKVNFTTVEKFIDAIGGIDVYSEYEFTPVKMKDWTVKEGMNHMNGKQALAFARERKAFVTGDNQRIKNQQAVFEAMIKKATSSRTMLFSYAKILNSLKDYFEMSFSSKEIRSIARMQLAKNPDWKIFKNTITGGDGSLPTYTTGGAYCYVMTQDEESIENAKTLINAVMNGQALGKDEDDKVIVAPSEEE
jgi:LCP family protein required for cell wall assembly